MNSENFLMRIFEGYCLCYRNCNWHTQSNYSDMTAAEVNFFSSLGTHLGYVVRHEMNRRDLCWCETPARDETPVLHLERENRDHRAMKETIDKLLNSKNSPDVKYLVAVFGWIRPETLEQAKNDIRLNMPKEQSFLIIAWIGEDQEHAYDIEAWIKYSDSEWTKNATPCRDKADYWYIVHSEGWNKSSTPINSE